MVLIYWLMIVFRATHIWANQDKGVVWLENPTCAGVLIEPDIVLSLKTCLGSETAIVWPYRSSIVETVKSPEANLAILKLEKSLPGSVSMIQIAERSHLKEGCPIYFSNFEQSTSNWIDSYTPEHLFFLYGLEPVLLGSPVFTTLSEQGERVVGLLIKPKQAIRLEPYYAFISKGIQFIRNGNRPSKAPVLEAPRYVALPAIPAQEAPLKSLKLPANSDPPRAIEPSVVPESVGCSCSQVRKKRKRL